MIELVLSILILIAAAMVISPLFKDSAYLRQWKSYSPQSSETYDQQELKNFSCRVRLITEGKDDFAQSAFNVEICGTIYVPEGCERAVANISITDVTEGIQKVKPVYALVEKWRVNYSQVFSFTANIGKLPAEVTTLSDWMTVARIPTDSLALPHSGKRNLQFAITILSTQTGAELVSAAYNVIYDNPSPGYIGLDENIQRAKTMAIPLAFVVAAADGEITAREVEIIKNWSKFNTPAPQASKLTHKLHNLLSYVIAFFPPCNRVYAYGICKKIGNIVPVKIKCDILELCLHVVAANNTIENNQLVLLKNMADCFGVSRQKFRSMAEDILTINMCEIEDLEISLGITSNMDKDQLCRQLSREYRKWNARVTNRNPEIENQAEHMLKLIAELRNHYVGQ